MTFELSLQTVFFRNLNLKVTKLDELINEFDISVIWFDVSSIIKSDFGFSPTNCSKCIKMYENGIAGGLGRFVRI